MTISLCALPMNFSMQIAHLTGGLSSSALCVQATGTSGESKKKKPRVVCFRFATTVVIRRCVVQKMEACSCLDQTTEESLRR